MEQYDLIIGNNLKQIREARNLSYTQLAELTGVSKSMLRQIEIGESSPTINTLWRIANGLEIPFTTLINPPVTNMSKLGFRDRSPLIGMSEGYRLYPLIGFDTTRSFEIYYVEMDAGVSMDADPHGGNAEEIVLVIQGMIEIRVREDVTEVAANEILRFDANFAHHYRNPSSEMAKGFMVISYARS